MQNITVDKAELIAKIQQNREEHKALYEEAVVVYRQRAIEEIEKVLAEAKRGDKIRHAFALPVPEEHTEDFDRALEMLEWEQGNSIVLAEYEFAQLVQNEWGWARNFAANTTSYTTGAR
jgi:hypothetical protein